MSGKKKTTKAAQTTAVTPRLVERRIYLVRGQKVMLDSDLAELYGVVTKRLNEQVRRNMNRFPKDFMFQLSREEAEALRSQIATLESGRGQHRKYRPYVFTEHGILMLSSVLGSKRAVQVNIIIMRTFVRLRRLVASHAELTHKLAALERKYDAQFKIVFDAIRELMEPPPTGAKRSIGFEPPKS
jgi:hypothetical protein